MCFSLDSETTAGKWYVNVKIEGKTVTFKLDTGADCNVMSNRVFQKIQESTQIALEKSHCKLKVYDGRRMSVIGRARFECEYKKLYKILTFNLVEQDLPSILGVPGIEELGLIKQVFSIKEADILDEYEDVFRGLGKIKGAEHTIHLKPDATPVIQPPR